MGLFWRRLLRQRRPPAPDGRQTPWPAPPEGRERERRSRRGSRRGGVVVVVVAGAEVHGLLRLREERRDGVEREAQHAKGEGELARGAGGGGAAVAGALDHARGAAVHVGGALHPDGEAAEPVGVALPHRQRGVAAAALDGHARACMQRNCQARPCFNSLVINYLSFHPSIQKNYLL
jgi:hypothetical protein